MIKIHINQDSLYVNKSNNLIGIIYFEIDDYIFISDDWYDFVSVLLAWLGKVILHLCTNEAKKVEMSFMEGPYKITFTMKENYYCKVECIEGEELSGSKELILKTSTIPLNEIIDAIIKACEIIIKLKDADTLDFDKSYDSLREVYQSLLAYKNNNY